MKILYVFFLLRCGYNDEKLGIGVFFLVFKTVLFSPFFYCIVIIIKCLFNIFVSASTNDDDKDSIPVITKASFNELPIKSIFFIIIIFIFINILYLTNKRLHSKSKNEKWK